MKKHFTEKLAGCIHPGQSNKNLEQPSSLTLKHQLLEKDYFTEKSSSEGEERNHSDVH